jgi:hypothetical protein
MGNTERRMVGSWKYFLLALPLLFQTNLLAQQTPPSINVKSYGVVGDARKIYDASVATGSNVLVSKSASFNSTSLNKSIIVVGAGVGGSNLISTIQSVDGPAQITIKDQAQATLIATAYWGTDNANAINSAIASVGQTGANIFFPIGTYLTLGKINVSTQLKTVLYGASFSSVLISDPGNYPLINIYNSQNVNVQQMTISNIHTVAAGSDDSYYPNILVTASQNVSIAGVQFIQGRGIQVTGSTNVLITNNTISQARDFGITVGSNSSGVNSTSNLITGTLTTHRNGPPHDINYEDTSNSLIGTNRIYDGPGMTESDASCMQLYTNHNPIVSNVEISNNTCIKSPVGTYVGFMSGGPGTYSNIVFKNNVFSGYTSSLAISGRGMNLTDFQMVIK